MRKSQIKPATAINDTSGRVVPEPRHFRETSRYRQDRRRAIGTALPPAAKAVTERILARVLRAEPCIIGGAVHVGQLVRVGRDAAVLFARCDEVDGEQLVLDVRAMGLEALEWEIERGRVRLLDEIAG